MGAAYRIQQGLRALASPLLPADDELARAHLTPALYMLYTRMRRTERQHGLRVLRDLLAETQTDPDLLTAGLLHDVGKTRASFTIIEKVLVVLINATYPALMKRWGTGSLHSWRRLFVVTLQHPIWSADMVKAAGGSPLAVELIRRHAEPLTAPPQTRADVLLLALKTADNRN